MAQQATTPPAKPAKPARPDAGTNLTPPDEAFWVRYSPHHEFPLSAVSSVAVHVLVFGLILLITLKLAFLFTKPVHEVPVEAVRFEGGGGGSPSGGTEGKGAPTSPQEVGAETTPAEPNPSPAETRPDLPKPVAAPVVAEKFDDSSTRFLTQVPRANTQAFVRLGDEVRRKVGDLQEGSRGKGGGGSGGGQGEGRGTGKGSGQGPGESKATLTQREKRMLRWTMHFNTNTGPDYLRQLAGLGAILAIPVREGPGGRDYKIVRDLSARPAMLLDEDISKIQRIYWIDDKPQSVADVMMTLGVNMRPSHFVAFMPPELENKLFEMEKAHARGRPEDDILETHFRVRQFGDHYAPEFESIRLK
jgi:hypothetical protein